MSVLIVHPVEAEIPTDFTRLLSHALAGEIIVLSVMSEALFSSHRSIYRDLPDVHMEYSVDHGEDSARRSAQAFASEALTPLGVEATLLGRVGDPLGVAGAVAKTYDVDTLYFTDRRSRPRRWYRRWRLTRLGFDGVVCQFSSSTAPKSAIDAENVL
jgi:hypothetical protein